MRRLKINSYFRFDKNKKVIRDSKIAKLDDFLYMVDTEAISIDTYEEGLIVDYVGDAKEFNGRCSAVYNNGIVGRNVDFPYSEIPDFIVHVKAGNGRYESIGMAMAAINVDDEDIEKGFDRQKKNVVAMSLVDGINEKGVMIEYNYIDTTDVGIIKNTNLGGKEVFLGRVVRYILDYASSAKEATEILKSINITGTENKFLSSQSGLHYMVADKNECYIVEIFDNKLKISKSNQYKISTNFTLTTEKPNLHGSGIERYEILKKHYDEGISVDGMSKLMQRVAFMKNAYDYEKENIWYSENNADMTQFGGKNLTIYSKKEDYGEKINETKKTIKILKRDPALDIWQSIHTVIYDLKNLYMRVYTQENYEKHFEYNI